jgi:Ca2+-binding RTX toxin-like protein
MLGIRTSAVIWSLATACLIAPGAAQAAPMDGFVGGGLLDVETGGGDSSPHTTTISYAGGAYTVTDPAGVNPGSGCSPVNPTTVTCGEAGVDGVVLAGGLGPDKLTIASLGPSIGSGGGFTTATGIFGGDGDDTIIGSDLVDSIRAGNGNDLIDGRLGGDNLEGQRGVDTVTYANRPASQAVLVDMTVKGSEELSPPDGSSGGSEGDEVGAENVIGTPGNDTIIGFGDDFTIHDDSAANTFTGGAGNDTLIGQIGADHLLGEAGNDRLLGGAQKDTLLGGSGRDTCSGGSSKDHAKRCERKRQIP